MANPAVPPVIRFSDMPDTDAAAQAMRRTRSAGDIPRDPSVALHRHSPSIGSPRPRSDHHDDILPATAPTSPELPNSAPAVVDAGYHHVPGRPPPAPPPLPTMASALPPLPPIQPRRHNRSVYSRTMTFFGYGRDASRERRSIVSLIWNLGWGFIQTVVVITLLVISSQKESPLYPGFNEWDACERPLGAWCCLWLVRVALASGLSYWGYRRDRASMPRTDAEAPIATGIPLLPPTTASTPATPTSNNGAMPGTVTSDPNPLPRTILFRRLSLLSSMLSVAWFLTAHILEYTSFNTCRHASPFLWWTVFGILCITYLLILEVFILGFVVFILAPILFLIYNILLMCLGRHPLQNPHMISPEIGKMPKSEVDRLPLVLYIPPPPGSESASIPVKVPEAIYAGYPPKSPSTVRRKWHFRFIKSKKKKNDQIEPAPADGTVSPTKPGPAMNWEDNWETQDGYPFVVLEGNRASCAICLMDFEEPKRKDGMLESTAPHDEEVATVTPAIEAANEIAQESRDTDIRLEDAGEGAQPLRLLACGHVFHKTCLDPWLTDVSGRCPVCQRPVDIPPAPRMKRKLWRRTTGTS